MHCTHCGAPNIDGAAFCTTCGKPLKAQADEQPQQAYTPPPQQAPAPPQQPAYTPPPQAYQPPPQQQAYPRQAPYPPQQPAGYGYPPQAPHPQQHPGYGYPQQMPPKKKKTGLVIGIVAGVVVIAVAVVLILVLGGGKSGGISGKWIVVETDAWGDYEEGLIFHFDRGTLKFEAPEGTPEEMKALYEMMNWLKTKYKVTGDKLILTAEFFGEVSETEMRYELDGDLLKLYDEDNVTTVLRRK